MRRYPMEKVLNMRDLGGYPAEGGATTRYGRFIRSDAPAGLTEAELERLLALGITTVVDLRGAGEAEAEPSDLAAVPGIRVVSLCLDEDVPWPPTADRMPEYYLGMAEGPALPAVLRALAAAPGPVLFHCAVGKDRTGVVSALLLGLAGVPWADIIADYQVSTTYLNPPEGHGHRPNPDMRESKAAYMHTFLREIAARYGGIPAFLAARGLSPGELAALRKKLLD